MFIFIVVVIAIVGFIFYSKSKKKQKKDAEWKAQQDFNKEAFNKLRSEHGFGFKGIVQTNDNDYRNGDTLRHIIVDTVNKKMAFISPKNRIIKVTTGSQIISVELKEQTGANHTQGNNLASHTSSSTFVSKLSVIIVTKNIGTIELCTYYNYNGSTARSTYYSQYYGYAVELKSAIEEIMPGTNNLKTLQDTPNTPSSSVSDELKRLNDLLKEGILTQEEFTKAKEKLLA